MRRNLPLVKRSLAIKFLLLLIGTAPFFSFKAYASKVTGVISDAGTGELLVGSTISIKNTTDGRTIHTAAGLDGSYTINNIPDGSYIVSVRYVGYQEAVKTVTINGNSRLNFALNKGMGSLTEVRIRADNKGSDSQARMLEKNSQNVLNIISAKQIQLSPDITVANVIQRVSGLSIERNASGDPQYAIVRGMDKRYNNTLINGIKTPSPDNENRFVPLDIFPAVFLERLEVYKSLTANMEADAIGGTVNMVMRSAPENRSLEADVQVGYNQLNFDRSFGTYDRSVLNRRSPKELFGADYAAVPADFPSANATLINKRALPDIFANLSYGERFLDKKLGVMLGGSFQNSYRPVDNYFYDPSATRLAGNPLNLNNFIDRNTSSQMERIAVHGKLDYRFNSNNNIGLYAGKYLLNEFRVRDQTRRQSFTAADNYPLYPITRFSNIFQDITTVHLKGDHKISDRFSLDWSAVSAIAKNDRPDDVLFSRAGTYSAANGGIINETLYFQENKSSRTWERNKDNDNSVYLNLKYRPALVNKNTEFQLGGVVRDRTRDNYYNYYSYAQMPALTKGVDWNTFGDIPWRDMSNPYGSGDQSNLVYDATERIYAGYFNTSWRINKTSIQAGIRAEHTRQTYAIDPLAATSDNIALTKEQSYLNWFPSVSVKQELNSKTNLRASYNKGISRPGFYEIVPAIRNAGGGDSFYNEIGNADLRPAIGHSADLRYEYFPSGVDQILVGVFYKKIVDPIEYGFPVVTSARAPNVSRILPQNFNNATNFGFEADYTKYFNRFGVRMNYTYTRSRITTNKVVQNADGSFALMDQTRALQGQSDHIGNVSLLWKDQKRKLDAQLVYNYTGERIAVVSPYYGADQWMKPMQQLDLSVEKGLGSRFVLLLLAGGLTVATSCSKSSSPAPQGNTGGTPTNPTTGISGDLSAITLTANTTYKVTGDLTVPEGKSVTVPAGVTFEFQEGPQKEAWYINVLGSLYVNGTASARVKFVPSAALLASSRNTGIGTLWGGITGTVTTGDIVIQYADILHAGGVVRTANAFAGEATNKELKEGDYGYALFFIRQADKRQDGIFVLKNSKVAFTPDDAIRINGGKTLMEYNVFEVTGGTGGDAVNIKAGAFGDFGFNLFYNLATNGLKSADTGPGVRGKLEANFYNNTIVASGYRRSEAGRGAGLNYESLSFGKCYNNLLVNNRFGLRLVAGETAPDVSKLQYGYNWYYGSVQSVVDQFYPNFGTSAGMIGYDARTPKPATDKVGGPKANDPQFVNFDPSTFVFSGNATIGTDQLRSNVTPMAANADFRLKSTSPALTGGKTDFAPVNADYKTLDGKLTFTPARPAAYFGAYGAN